MPAKTRTRQLPVDEPSLESSYEPLSESSDNNSTDFEPYGSESSTDLSSYSKSGVPDDLELYDYNPRCVG